MCGLSRNLLGPERDVTEGAEGHRYIELSYELRDTNVTEDGEPSGTIQSANTHAGVDHAA